MKPPYNFGMSQEDERTEAAALGLPGGRVLSIASAGDMALSLLSLGAEEIVAVDVDPAQLCLAELKRAAVLSLARGEAIRFLGFLPASRAQRKQWLIRVLPVLPHSAKNFWSLHPEAALNGAIWAGRYERYVRMVGAWLNPILGGRFRALFRCATLAEQRAVFEKHFNRPLLRATFRAVFSPRLFARRGMDPRSLQYHDSGRSVGDQYFAQFEAMCTATSARENFLLQLHLLGRVHDVQTVPAYLTERGAEAVRRRPSAVTFIHASMLDHLETAPVGRFDRFHLSNLPDWEAPAAFDRLLRTVASRAARPTRMVWRYLHRNHTPARDLQQRMLIDSTFSESLRGRDRFPVYGIVAARMTS